MRGRHRVGGVEKTGRGIEYGAGRERVGALRAFAIPAASASEIMKHAPG
jgi:hypothetical protein